MGNKASSQVSNAKKKQLEELNLSDCKLKGEIPPQVATKLPNLSLLDLSTNKLKSAPSNFSELTTLRVLCLDHNAFTEIPAVIFTMVTLRELRMSSNAIAELPKDVSRLTGLRMLHANNNKIAALPESLATLTTLTSLRLANNLLGPVVPEWLGHMRQLTELELAGNPLPPAVLALLGDGVAAFLASLLPNANNDALVMSLTSLDVVQSNDANLDLLKKPKAAPSAAASPMPGTQESSMEMTSVGEGAMVTGGFYKDQKSHTASPSAKSQPSTPNAKAGDDTPTTTTSTAASPAAPTMITVTAPADSKGTQPQPVPVLEQSALQSSNPSSNQQSSPSDTMAASDVTYNPLAESMTSNATTESEAVGVQRSVSTPNGARPAGQRTSQLDTVMEASGSGEYNPLAEPKSGHDSFERSVSTPVMPSSTAVAAGAGVAVAAVAVGAVAVAASSAAATPSAGAVNTPGGMEVDELEPDNSAFLVAGREPDSLEVFMLVKLVPTVLPQKDQGIFFSKECYVILRTTPEKEYRIFYWFGREASPEKRSAAVLSGLHLKRHIGKKAAEAHEDQGDESREFRDLFIYGFEVRTGGSGPVLNDSKAARVQSTKTRLYRIKGAKKAQLEEMTVSYKSLNRGDVFILDTHDVLYQWNGSSANRNEKSKGLEVTQKIKNRERNGRARVVVVDEGDEGPEFWAGLGGEGPIASAEAGGDDKEIEKSASQDLALICIAYDEENGLQLIPISDGVAPQRDNLESIHAYILDCVGEIFVWMGKQSDAFVRKAAMRVADAIMNKYERPEFTSITRVSEGLESVPFKEKFASWSEVERRMSPEDIVASRAKIAKVSSQVNLNHLVARLNNIKPDAPELELPDGDQGDGVLEVYRMDGARIVKLEDEEKGLFYQDQCFICVYLFLDLNDKVHIRVYFWEGKGAKNQQFLEYKMGFYKQLEAKLHDEYGQPPLEIRVAQSKEPAHFNYLFRGRMVVRIGTAGTTRNEEDPVLFHVRGRSTLDARAVEVSPRSKNLNSNDVFVLMTATKQLLWLGRGSNAAEREVANQTARILSAGQEVIILDEGAESEEFWTLLGGKEAYMTSERLADESHPEPKLFHCSNATGVLLVEPIVNFSQRDLLEDDVFLLDAYDTVFVWIGTGANDHEKEMGMEVALKYIEKVEDDRDRATCSTVRVDSGNEPELFTAHFHAWARKHATVRKSKPKERKGLDGAFEK